MTREFRITGWHVLIGFVLAFGVIIAVNITLAVSAVRTFPGLEVKNSYIASQTFNDRKAAQTSLGWTVKATHSDGLLRLAITDVEGQPVRVAKLDATVGRATHVADDFSPEFRFEDGAYVFPVDLADGNWNIRMSAISGGGTPFEQRVVLIKR